MLLTIIYFIHICLAIYSILCCPAGIFLYIALGLGGSIAYSPLTWLLYKKECEKFKIKPNITIFIALLTSDVIFWPIAIPAYIKISFDIKEESL